MRHNTLVEEIFGAYEKKRQSVEEGQLTDKLKSIWTKSVGGIITDLKKLFNIFNIE